MKQKEDKTRETAHPFTKTNLKVVDSFEPSAHALCPVCWKNSIFCVTVAESEMSEKIRYYKLSCSSCRQSYWVILTRKRRNSGYVY